MKLKKGGRGPFHHSLFDERERKRKKGLRSPVLSNQGRGGEAKAAAELAGRRKKKILKEGKKKGGREGELAMWLARSIALVGGKKKKVGGKKVEKNFKRKKILKKKRNQVILERKGKWN